MSSFGGRGHRSARIRCPKCGLEVFRSEINKHKRRCDGDAVEEVRR